ncbi:hypothetical protein ColKHC_14334 [Colletotrichum higginsianum]|nr:hypothetical protein ColKHC_14334 [Colletotrichum higginsianum]
MAQGLRHVGLLDPFASSPRPPLQVSDEMAFPRGDLYHWIPLLNRFDNILDCFSTTYNLDQVATFFLSRHKTESYGDQIWDAEGLSKLGYEDDGDRQLIEAVLKFTRTLLEHCGNRSIYSSSMVLNKLLNTTALSVLLATLQVSAELAQRYQASVKRIGSASRTVSTALLGNHYQMTSTAYKISHCPSPRLRR